MEKFLMTSSNSDSPNYLRNQSICEESKLPLILDGKFFKVIEKNTNGNVKARCIACAEGNSASTSSGTSADIISGKLHPTSNFTSHLKRRHPTSLASYQAYLKTMDQDVKQGKQTKLNFERTLRCGMKSKSEHLIVNFVVDTMQPLSIVEEPSFRALILGHSSNGATMCNKTLRIRINNEFNIKTEQLKQQLADINNVCLTTDIWSSRRRSFLGATCHWIEFDGKTFCRKSVPLALKRFVGSHTNETIAENLQLLMSEFGLHNKVVSIVTDNGSNFVKAFGEFCSPDSSDTEMSQGSQQINTQLSETVDAVDDDSPEICEFPILDDIEIYLPQHIRCASHTLNLIGKTEPNMILPNGSSAKSSFNKKVMRRAMAKCSSLWSKASRSTKIAEAIKDLTSNCLVQPNTTRWNSTYDAIGSLLKKEEYLEEVFTIADITSLTGLELTFLKEYSDALFPIAWALDKLQSEKDFYFGYLCPTLLTAKSKLDRIANLRTENDFASSIAAELSTKLVERFSGVFSFDVNKAKMEIMSTATLPFFKLRWLPAEMQGNVKKIFIEEAKKVSASAAPMAPVVEQSDWDEIMPASEVFPVTSNCAEIECLKYFQDDETSMDSLIKYPIVKTMFEYFNTSLPSSAPSERLFSYALLIFRPNRSQLNDDMFEKLCFLKLYKDV